MTLCIGAMATAPVPFEPRLVLCFDFKVAGDEFGSESEYKFHVLSNDLVAMVAGSPGRAKELALIYQEHLKKITLEPSNAVDQLRGPVATLKRRLAESYVQRRLAISYDDLIQHSEAWLGSERREKYLTTIENHHINVDMVIAGFIGETPVLFDLRDGELEVQTNFALIGVGRYTAEPALHFRKHERTTTLRHALYNVYEAKKLGEASPFVGQKTRMYVISPAPPDSTQIQIELITPIGEKLLEGLFKRYGPRAIKQIPGFPADAFEVAARFAEPKKKG